MVDDKTAKSRYLTVYDYGTGGVWSFVLARTAKEIEDTFRDLNVVESTPDWLNDDERMDIEKHKTFDIDDIQPTDATANGDTSWRFWRHSALWG
jgi:hypothetical protein